MDVRRSDRKASLASVAGELEMEEQGDGAKLLKSKASTAWKSFACCFSQACRIGHAIFAVFVVDWLIKCSI